MIQIFHVFVGYLYFIAENAQFIYPLLIRLFAFFGV
jgi:hypothetical protein